LTVPTASYNVTTTSGTKPLLRLVLPVEVPLAW